MAGRDEVPEYSKEVAKGSFWNFAGNLMFKLVSFFYVVYLARAISQDDLGIFFLALSIISFGTLLDSVGLGGAFTRFIPYYEGRREPGKIASLVRAGFMVSCVFSVLFAAAAFLSAGWLGEFYGNPALVGPLQMLSVFIMLDNLYGMNVAYLRGRANMKAFQSTVNLQNLAKLVLTVVIFQLFGASVENLILSFLLSFAAAIAFSGILVHRDASRLPAPSQPLAQTLREALPFGLMLSLINSVGLLVLSTSQALLGYLSSPEDSAAVVAVFSVSATLAAVAMVPSASISSIFFPVISRLFARRDFPGMRHITETAQRWSLLLTIPVGLVMILFSQDILASIYGEQYRAGWLVLSILTAAYLLKLLSNLPLLVLSSMKRLSLQLMIVLASGFVNLLLGIILIPMLGMEGSAIASFAGFTVGAVLVLSSAEAIFGYRLPEDLYRIFLAAGISFVVMAALSPLSSQVRLAIGAVAGEGMLSKAAYLAYLVLLAAFSALLFFLLSFLLRCMRDEDLALLKKAMGKVGFPPGAISLADRLASPFVAGGAKGGVYGQRDSG